MIPWLAQSAARTEHAPLDRRLAVVFFVVRRRFSATASLNAWPGANEGISRAGTVMATSGLRGFRATR